ncbi:MAG TPA: MmgE/PrpD family protein [Hyphomicrobiaceae bacterium]|nr:MmgE/PrpD family protein [Hyphomicrobiaceae bacterium]
MAHGAADNRYTRGIAEFVSGLRYEQIPQDVLARLKLLMLDSLGCALFGARLEWSQILRATLAAVDTSSGATLWGTSERLSAPHAALVNGTAVQSFELDDVHRHGVLHVGAVTLPALFAAVETKAPGSFTGKDLLRAAVAGYEIGPRVGICMGQEHIGQGWHSGATVGVFSAAAGASAALSLNAEQTVHALGIGGTQSAGLMAAQYGAMVKRMHAGRSAQSGLYGALLAARGFTGIADVFESRYGGFCTTFSRSQDRFNLEELTAGLGERWETMRISLKFYSCVGSNHTTLDAIRNMQTRRAFGPNDIERIIVHGSQVTMDHVGWRYRPEGLTSAQLNLPFCVATLLIEGDCFVDQFSDAIIADPARIALAEKVEVKHDDAITARGSKFRHMVRVEAHLKDGTRLEETVEAPRGSEASFASEADVVAKFTKLATHAVPAKAVERIAELVLGLERVADAGELVQALGQAPAARN